MKGKLRGFFSMFLCLLLALAGLAAAAEAGGGGVTLSL